MKKRLVGLFAAAMALLLGGCAMNKHPGLLDSARTGPFFTPKNYIGDLRLPDSVRRVVLLPVCGGVFASQESAEELDPVFAAALQRQMRFEVVTLTREECQKTFEVPEVNSASALPRDFLTILGKKFGADAVLFVDLTAYQAYRPITLGIRAKLATIEDCRIIWSFDDIFSATNPAVANSARHYYVDNEYSQLPFDMTIGVLQSPTRFAAYVADATFATLPKR